MKFENKKIDLKEFIPKNSINVKTGKTFEVELIEDEKHLIASYEVPLHNQNGLCGTKRHAVYLPKFVKADRETFEVLGLLQAEMGKQHDGKIVFCNHEFRIINKVLNWFEKQLNHPKDDWKWSIKVNINEPSDKIYKKIVEEKIVNYWMKKTRLKMENSYDKNVTYITNTENKKLKKHDYGTLIFERKHNLLSQIIKNFVKTLTNDIINFNKEEIRSYMRGIIAGESNVEVHNTDKRFRVFITARSPIERTIFKKCLERIEIYSKEYVKNEIIVISKKQNLFQLYKQNLITLSTQKYNRFRRIINFYDEFEELHKLREERTTPHNKIPDWIINEVLLLQLDHRDWSSYKIAEELQGLVSPRKIQEIRHELLPEIYQRTEKRKV